MILAGDVGGTKCNLGLFRQEGTRLNPVFQRRLATREYASFEELVKGFLKQAVVAGNGPQQIDAAGFGVAGVVANGRHYSENLPWLVDPSVLTQKLKLKNVRLLNDLTATAFSLERLSKEDLVVLNSGTPADYGTKGVIAAGTGLGEAYLFWGGAKYQVSQAEGGQTEFAPRTDREIQLLRHLKLQLPHVSCEEIISGRGFRRIHEFLNPTARHESFDSPAGSAAGEITQQGLAKSCKVCVETLDFWTELFGAATGNFALQIMALGGVYVAGGIAAKILPKLQEGAFFKSFCGVSQLAPVLARIPLSVVVNEEAPMLGAAYEALLSTQAKGLPL
jgi:glucokinase